MASLSDSLMGFAAGLAPESIGTKILVQNLLEERERDRSRVSPRLAQALERPDLEGFTREDLLLLLQKPFREAQITDIKAQAKEREARAKIPRPSQLASEDFRLFQLATQSAMKNPLTQFASPEERNATIADEFAVLKAARAGKPTTQLPSKAIQSNILPPRKNSSKNSGKIHVRIKATGQSGYMNEDEFDPAVADKL